MLDVGSGEGGVFTFISKQSEAFLHFYVIVHMNFIFSPPVIIDLHDKITLLTLDSWPILATIYHFRRPGHPNWMIQS